MLSLYSAECLYLHVHIVRSVNHVHIQYVTLLFVMHTIHAFLHIIHVHYMYVYMYHLHCIYNRVLTAQCWGLIKLLIYMNLILSAYRYYSTEITNSSVVL
jgi:hypothetical protein